MPLRVALVCDTMSAFGGAERVIEQILQIFPAADVFSILDIVPETQRAFLKERVVRSSFLQRLPKIEKYYRKLLPLWPLAVEQFDVTNYDLVISSHHSVAYGVITRPGQVHVAYVHSPMRYAWDQQHVYLREAHLDVGPMGFMARRSLQKLRVWDYAAAQRPESIAANSSFVAERLWRTHRRSAVVIYPPVAVDRGGAATCKGDYYISLGRLVPYKRVDLLVRAFSMMPQRRLVVVGDGPEKRKIASLAAPNVDILGFQPTERVRELVAGAKAYVFAGVEDFGIAAIEAQAAGTAVIAFRRGGLAETVIGPEFPSPTGVFFEEQTEESIIAAITEFEREIERFSAKDCLKNAARFSEERFRHEFSVFVDEALAARRQPAHANPMTMLQHPSRTRVPDAISA